MDRDLASLSFGETQKVDIACCLAKSANLYLIDEPSEYLDADERLIAATAIRRHLLRVKDAAVIVEHDFMMAAYLADQVILVEEKQPPTTTELVTSSHPSTITEFVTSRHPSTFVTSRHPSTITEFVTSSPYPRVAGLNKFLEHQNITFRRDPLSYKFIPRVNKLGSIEDTDQKLACNYYDLNLT